MTELDPNNRNIKEKKIQVNAFKMNYEYYFCGKFKLLLAKLVKKQLEKTSIFRMFHYSNYRCHPSLMKLQRQICKILYR
ncbi:hypothetical protein C4F40_21140 [Sphingobacterium sp. Ka21]|uniref:Uncharacterized protein n=1 Tax=Sphingobacterium pedocola TaxID=2082722 RepID=A0ABR9TEY3_9SPHI|nr:hypothetical protein [Sphingobacterium pedocola]